MRLSSPMPRATSWISAPTFSDKSAISLMKVILVARKALAAYLINSAVRSAVNIIGAWFNDVGRRIDLVDQPFDLVTGADRNGRFGDDHGKALQRAGDLARGGVDIAQVGVAVAAPRRC